MQNDEAAADSKLSAGVRSREKKIVFLLCLLAAIHVFIFSAAFPFFNDVDEPTQLDHVLRYSHGEVPRKMENYTMESSVYIALFCSCAYLGPTAGPIPPPPWTEPVDKMNQDVAFNSAGWRTQLDYECSEPPLYYSLAGLWWNTGKHLGLASGRLLFWLRFFNILPVVALVWLAYATASLVFPDNAFTRLAVPTLAALMPQTAYYSIGSDVLSPLCFGATFFFLVLWLRQPSALNGAAMGLAYAATYLTKATNVPLLAVAGIAILIKTWQEIRAGKFSKLLPALAAFAICAAPPIFAWMLWCESNYGSLTGSQLKSEHLGWTLKPLSQWWHHPIFTPFGLWTYLIGELGTFWQGQFHWYYPPAARFLALPGSRGIYTVISLVFTGVAALAVLPGGSRVTPFQRSTLRLSLAIFLAGLVFYAGTSMAYDYHNCTYPSQGHPYFDSGRMFLGALIPFLLLFVYGIDRVLARFKEQTKFVVFGAAILVMLTVEVVTDWPAFSNDYNWFHLP